MEASASEWSTDGQYYCDVSTLQAARATQVGEEGVMVSVEIIVDIFVFVDAEDHHGREWRLHRNIEMPSVPFPDMRIVFAEPALIARRTVRSVWWDNPKQQFIVYVDEGRPLYLSEWDLTIEEAKKKFQAEGWTLDDRSR